MACEASKWCYAVAEPLKEWSEKSGKYIPGTFYLMRNSPGCHACFDHGSKFTMHAKSAMSPEKDGQWSDVQVSADGKCTQDKKNHTCVVKPVGFWKSLRSVTLKETLTESWGTTHSQTDLSSLDYANEVKFGITTSAGWSNGGGKPGPEASVEVSSEFRSEWSLSFSTEISTEVKKENIYEVKIDDDRQLGKHLWQFAQKNTGSCGESTTLFRSHVFTAGLSQKPCCYPGHCTDAHLFSCDWCAKGYMVPNPDLRCKEGSPPCPRQNYQLQNVNAFVIVEELSEGQIREQPCPSGYSGAIASHCAKTKLTMTESCSKNGVSDASSSSHIRSIHVASSIIASYHTIAAFL